MNYRAIDIWLQERGIVLTESFAETLRGYALEYKKDASYI